MISTIKIPYYVSLLLSKVSLLQCESDIPGIFNFIIYLLYHEM